MRRFDIRPTIPLILSVALGAAAVIMVRGYISGEKASLTQAMDPVAVVVAQRNIEANVPISMDMIAARGVPRQFVHAKSIYPEESRLLVGRELIYPVRAGDPLLWMDFKGGEGIRTFSSMIREGERALTLQMDAASGIAGLLQPGDHVDILGTFSDPTGSQQVPGGRGAQQTTITLLQDVVVLAVGSTVVARTVRERDGGANMLTVLVTPEEAMLLVHAQKQGDLYNILRNPSDLETVEGLPRITFTDILQPRVREEIQTARDTRITVIRRGVESRERVE